MNQPARNIERGVLPNGLVVITEHMPHVRSVSVGIWLRTGSRGETADRAGLSHFIEHMVFKGTARRTAEEIARQMDSVGGMLDAFTEKEIVCFNGKVLDEHLGIAFDVISDLVLRPRFDEDDVEREKQVVLEEVRMEEDNPEYLVHEMFTQGFWREHALGRPILGTRETIPRFSREAMLDAFRTDYAPNNAVLTAAGNCSHAHLMELAEREFGGSARAELHSPDGPPRPEPALVARSKRELEQVHVCIGAPSCPLADERRYAVSLLNNILGGSMSSRLFQNIREKQALAYAVFSDLNLYSDAGMLSVYAGTAPATAEQLIRSVMEECGKLKKERVAEEELRRAKDHLKGSLVLSLESSGARMSQLARHEIYFKRFFTIDETLAGIEAVTREEILKIAGESFESERIAAAAVGPPNGFRLTRDLLAC
jgi:predicted Zn-dependent peptidase